MESAMHLTTKVLPGKKIEVSSPSLVEGQQVELIIVFPPGAGEGRRTVMDILETTAPPGLFSTAEQVDEYLEGERSSWDR